MDVGPVLQYQNADHWYHNLDKLIHYVNKNGTINLLYSTPTTYVKAKHAETIKKGMKWEVCSISGSRVRSCVSGHCVCNVLARVLLDKQKSHTVQ